MDWVNLLTNSATGGLLGLVGSIGTGWIKLKAKKQENIHSLALMNLAIKKDELAADSADFTASQQGAQAESESIGDLATGSSNGQRWILVLVTAYKGTVRPNLAYLVHILAAVAFYYATPDVRSVMIMQIFNMAALYGGWYFGQRDINKRLNA
jgi:hypothetical protein